MQLFSMSERFMLSTHVRIGFSRAKARGKQKNEKGWWGGEVGMEMEKEKEGWLATRIQSRT